MEQNRNAYFLSYFQSLNFLYNLAIDSRIIRSYPLSGGYSCRLRCSYIWDRTRMHETNPRTSFSNRWFRSVGDTCHVIEIDTCQNLTLQPPLHTPTFLAQLGRSLENQSKESQSQYIALPRKSHPIRQLGDITG